MHWDVIVMVYSVVTCDNKRPANGRLNDPAPRWPRVIGCEGQKLPNVMPLRVRGLK